MSLHPTLQVPLLLSLAIERILTSTVTSGGEGLFKLLQLYFHFLGGQSMHLMGLLRIKLDHPQETPHT